MSLAARALDHATALDRLARRDTILGRVDARAKLIATLGLLFTIASFSPHDLSRPLPLAIFLAVTLALGQVPLSMVLTRLLVASPFALMVAIWNPVFDTATAWQVGTLEVSAGWISFTSVLLRFAFALSAVLVLIATTGFDEVCRAARSLGAPRLFVTQLLLLYRYSFVIAGEVGRMLKAHSLRRPGKRPTLAVARHMLGQLLLRALGRAERIHAAMLCRGFAGVVPVRTGARFGAGSAVFVVTSLLFFVAVRGYDWLALATGDLARTP